MAPAILALAALVAAPPSAWMPARAPATVTVRILAAARVQFGPAEQRLVRAAVHIDGTRRSAMLVEFQ